MRALLNSQLLLETIYLIAAMLFILSLKWLSSPASARRGVRAGATLALRRERSAGRVFECFRQTRDRIRRNVVVERGKLDQNAIAELRHFRQRRHCPQRVQNRLPFIAGYCL